MTCFLIAEVFFVLADHKVESKAPIDKKLEDVKQEDVTLSDIDFLTNEKLSDAQRKRDPGYYYGRSNSFPFRNNHGFGRNGYRGRIVTRLQSQINRPFKQYGPPSQEGQSLRPEPSQSTTPSNIIINQGIPSPIRWNDFAEESPIASQNNEPFGQHTANYLPPQNQKLPAPTSGQLFSNVNHDFPDQQQLHLQHQQEQFTSQQLQQRPQLQDDNQNFLGQDFNTLNQNFGQNEFTDQQISDATLFLTQNAQAISNLYGAPAPNQNYAPNNQEFEQIEQQQQFQPSLNLQVSTAQTQGFPAQLPSYATGILNGHESFQNVQSIEKDRLIAQLQQALSNRQKSGRLVQNINNNNFGQTESLAAASSQFSAVRPSNSFVPSTTLSTLDFQGYYGSSTPITSTTQTPLAATPTITTTTTTVQPSPGSSGAGTTQIGTSLPAPGGLKPTVVNPVFSQYGGFVPTFFAPSFVPSIPSYGTTLFPATGLKPAESSPTHFGIPIPTFQGQKPSRPTQPASTTPSTTKPPSHPPSRPSTPTFSIDLGPVRPVGTPVQPPVIKPNPVPVFPAATPVHPTYGLHPAVFNPAFVYKPVKVVPVYYYPNVAYQHLQKPVAAAAATQPWSYAPSYTQTKPLGIWK